MKKIPYSIVLLEPTHKLVEELRARYGYGKTELFRVAIIEMHKRAFPNYLETLKLKQAETADAKIEREVEHKKKRIKKQEEEDYKKQKAICDILGGTELTKGGIKICRYVKYNFDQKFESEIPFSELSQAVVEAQYNPDKETCAEWING